MAGFGPIGSAPIGSTGDDESLNPIPVKPEAERQPVTAGATPTSSPSGLTLQGGVMEVAVMPLVDDPDDDDENDPPFPPLPVITPPLVQSDEVASSSAIRRRINTALMDGGASEPPLPLRASVEEKITLQDHTDATVIPAEWRRIIVELRDLSERAERSLTEFQKAIEQPDRFSIGGNDPPEAIRKSVVDGILAAKVVRLEADVEEPSWPVLELALTVLKQTASAIGSWIADMWEKFSTAAAVAAGTAVGGAIGVTLAKAANLDLTAVINALEGLVKVVGALP